MVFLFLNILICLYPSPVVDLTILDSVWRDVNNETDTCLFFFSTYHLLAYCLCYGTRSGHQAPVRANDIHVSVPVGERSQVSLVNIANPDNKHLHAITPE